MHVAITRGFIKPDLKKILHLYSGLEEPKNCWGHTPLISAITSQNISAVKLLLKRGANVNEKDNSGTSVLQQAYAGINNQIFALIYKKADKSLRTKEMKNRYRQIKNIQQRSHRLVNYLRKPSELALVRFCQKYEEFELVIDPPKPRFDNAISQGQAALWIDSHPSELQDLARKIVDNITHVSFRKFKAQLKSCVEDFNNQLLSYPIKEQGYILVVPELCEKSNPWVFSHALRYFNTMPEDVVRINDLSSYFENYDKDKQINLLFMDDASYSGTQMKYDVDLANQAANDGNLSIKVHCLIPFMTKRAHELLSAHNDTFFGNFEIILAVKHLFDQSEKEILQENNINSSDEITCRHINWPEMTLTYFEHKIADWKSTFTAILKEGRTIDSYDCKVPFIPLTIEPYKKNISLPIRLALALRGDHYEQGLPKQKNNNARSAFTPSLNFSRQFSGSTSQKEKASSSNMRCVIS